MEDDINDILLEFRSLDPDPPEVRAKCEKCRRPATTCWCSYLPAERLHVDTTIYVLQHPYEETRNLQTGLMLTLALQDGCCHTFKGKRFPIKRFPMLESVVSQPNTLLMWPGPEAEDLKSFLASQHRHGTTDVKYTLIILDGTWHQARSLYNQNSFLHSLKQVQLSDTGLSKYVIRTQPNNSCLSTVETVALAISQLENRPEVYQALIRPLQALCNYQLLHGAVMHHSRQHMIDNGLYIKQRTKLSTQLQHRDFHDDVSSEHHAPCSDQPLLTNGQTYTVWVFHTSCSAIQ